MKYLHPLKTPKNSDVSDFYVLDTETYNEASEENSDIISGRPQDFVFACIYGKDGYTKFMYALDEVKQELKQERYTDKYVFMHNATYDLNVIYDNIFKIDKKAIFNGRFIKATNGNCTFADSLNIYRCSVKKIGELIGIPKLDFHEKGRQKRWKKGIVNDIDREYCLQDCKIVYQALLEMFYECGKIAITQASLSMIYFRANHLQKSIRYEKEKVDFFDGEHSYYGGRTEIFRLGNCQAVVYDINSMYPYAMKVAKFPNPSRLIRSKFEPHIIKRIQETEGVAHVKVQHEETEVGYLPYRMNGKLVFPVGTFSGWWNFNELRFAINSGKVKIIEFYEAVYSKKPIDSPFISYIDELYTRRLNTKDWFEKYRIKVFMNSLYGKFGEKIEEERIYLENVTSNESMKLRYDLMKEGKNASCEVISANRQDGWLIIEKDQKSQAPHAIPLFASYITSFARVELLKYITKYWNHGVLYCDTDSLFVEKPLPLENSSELGALKLEEKIVTEIRNLKDYEYIDENRLRTWARKGVPKKAKEILPDVFQYWDMVGTLESIVRLLPAGQPILRKKELKSSYNKREVCKLGATKPIVLQ